MQSKRKTNTGRREIPEKDSTYILKLVLFVILGTLWLKFSIPVGIGPLNFNGVPIGLFIGLIFASHEHFQVDRKLEYAVLIIMTIIAYFLPAGIII